MSMARQYIIAPCPHDPDGGFCLAPCALACCEHSATQLARVRQAVIDDAESPIRLPQGRRPA